MNNDDQINELKSVIDAKKKLLGPKQRFYPKTNCNFIFNDGERFNLNVENDVHKIALAYGYLITRSRDYKEACERLNVQFKEYTHSGYLMSEWEDDFKNKISCIKWDIEKKNLDILETKLESLMSAEGKTKTELENIKKQLQI